MMHQLGISSTNSCSSFGLGLSQGYPQSYRGKRTR